MEVEKGNLFEYYSQSELDDGVGSGLSKRGIKDGKCFVCVMTGRTVLPSLVVTNKDQQPSLGGTMGSGNNLVLDMLV